MINNEQISSRNLLLFINEITKLEPIELIGIAKIFGISLISNDKEIKNFEDMLSEIIDGYISLGRKQRKELIKEIKLSNKVKRDEDKNGNAT